MQLGSDHRTDGTDTHGAEATSTAPSGTEVAPGPARPEVEVLRHDPLPRRLAVRWRRAGDAEGRRSEWHPLRAALLVAVVAALTWWLPGAAVFLGILVALILVHEVGHLVVARRCGMRPTEYFLGFGPTVWSRTSRSGLRWGVKAVILGGYVKIPGMGPSEEVEASLEPYTYRAATRPRRLAVILAGVGVNFLVALLLFWTYAMWAPDIDVGPVRAATGSGSLMWEVSRDTVTSLGDLVTGAADYSRSVADGEVPEQRMVSAVGGAQLTDGLLDQHPSRLLLLAGLFSTSIAVFNLLPLLPLDGGHAAIVVTEGAIATVRRRPRYRLDPNRFRVAAAVVVVALLALGATSMYVDVLHPLSAAG
ncbi:site-2 protease family protein [Dermatobacter hominis]|uniref:site-2 protease family protein n=1 Tax=Dermatobacter hominis TaxID=2884263 RepID=UPI001D123D58|nr:site-2 protease family protein [Dermatobacter hominis]UDY34051.1 site-2 protease family protein [Dermatobacter hominis]